MSGGRHVLLLNLGAFGEVWQGRMAALGTPSSVGCS